MSKKLQLLVALLLIFLQLKSQDVTTLLTDPIRGFEALHWHDDGRIYAVDYSKGNLYQVFLDGTVTTIADEFQNLAGGGFDKDGNFYFSDIAKGDLYRLNEDDSYTKISSGYLQPVALLQSLQDDNIMYVSEWQSSRVSKCHLDTGNRELFVAGQGIFGPDALVQGFNDDIIVANFNNHRIYSITHDGDVSLFASVPANGNMGYITKTENYLYVPSLGSRKIYQVDKDGNSVVIAGSGSNQITDGSGELASFSSPNGIIASPTGDTLLVSDGKSIRMIRNFESPVSIDDTGHFVNFQINPNPVTTSLVLDIDSPLSMQLSYKMYDGTGQVVASNDTIHIHQGTQKINVDMESMVAGMYFIVFNRDGSHFETLKFLKQ